MVFVIAEIGVNWDGNFETAKNMIKNLEQKDWLDFIVLQK